jgi:hypothetical protein
MQFGELTPDQERIRALVERHAKEQGVDPRLAQAVAWQESKFKPDALGPLTKYGRAIGPMQVMGTNAPGLKMKVEDLYVPEKNIPAGMRILKENLDRYGGHENAALAAYNASPTYANRYVKGNYDESVLPKETQEYFKKIAAIRGSSMQQEKPRDLSRFGSAPEADKDEKQQERLSRFGSLEPLPEHLTKPFTREKEVSRPNFEGQSSAFRGITEPLRESSGDVSLIPGGVAGAVTGALISPVNKKELEYGQNRLRSAQDAYTQAKAEIAASRKAAAEHIGGQRVNVTSSASDLAAKQANLAKLEAEVRAAQEALQKTQPLKLSGSQQWTNVMGGEDVPLAKKLEAENMRGNNPRGGQAIIDADAAAKQKLRNMGLGGFSLTEAKPGQLALPDRIAAEKNAVSVAEQDDAAKRVADLKTKADLARQEASAAEALNRTQATNLAKGESSMAQSLMKGSAKQQAAQALLKEAEKGATSGVPKLVASMASSPVLGRLMNSVAGAGVGMSITEANNRYEKGDVAGAARIGLAGVLDALALMPAGTPITAAIKAIGIGGGLAAHIIDAYYQNKQEGASQPQPQPKAQEKGVLQRLMPTSGSTTMKPDAYGRYRM